MRIRDRVRVSVTVYSAVYSAYLKFHICRPSRYCYRDFSGRPTNYNKLAIDGLTSKTRLYRRDRWQRDDRGHCNRRL